MTDKHAVQKRCSTPQNDGMFSFWVEIHNGQNLLHKAIYHHLTLAQSVVVLCNFVSNMTFTFERSRYIEAGVRATTIVHLAFIHIYSHQIIKHCRRWKHSGVNFCQQPKNSRNIAEFLSSNLMVNFSLCSSTKVWSSYCQWYKHKR